MVGARAADLRKVQQENREIALELLSFSSSQSILNRKKYFNFPFGFRNVLKMDSVNYLMSQNMVLIKTTLLCLHWG